MYSEKILASIAQITRQRDLDALELCLVATLVEFIPGCRISLYHLLSATETHKIREVISLDAGSGDPDIDFSSLFCAGEIMDTPDLVAQCIAQGDIVSRPDGDSRHAYVCPVRYKGNIVDVIAVLGDVPSESDKRLIHGFIKIYENYLEVLDERERDTLTGLFNRRTFEGKLAKLLQAYRPMRIVNPRERESIGQERRIYSSKESHWLAILDIDQFKNINDTYGHVFGDEVLLLISQLMKKFFRQNDLLFRFGGEEFVIVLRPTSEKNTSMLLERFRAAVNEYKFPRIGNVTISIGYTKMTPDDYHITVIDAADKALYYAKDNGRNRICNYEQLVATGKVAPIAETSDIVLFN